MTLVVLLLLALSIAGYFYYQYRQSAEVADAKEIESLAQEIGQFMILPEGEEPTLATVTDREKLAEQPFFQKAENGDKVLIFSQSGRAILYRPSQKKIVDVTSVNVNTPTPAPTQTTTETAPPETVTPSESAVPVIVRVAIRNGSETVGLTNLKEKLLTSVYKNIAVVTKENAAKNSYEETTVIDITGKNSELALQVAGTLGGVVAPLPSEEGAPTDADILIIVADKK